MPIRLDIALQIKKIDYVIVMKNFQNPEGHQNPISCSKVMAILLKGWILPIGEAEVEKAKTFQVQDSPEGSNLFISTTCEV